MTTSDESADTSLQLVLEFLAAKGLHSAAAALRAEVSTVGLTPASRSKLERLVAGAGAAGEAEEPDPLATDGLSLAPLAEPNDGSSAPRFYQPSGDASQDGWDDDDDLGYERVFTHEVLSSPASTSGGSPVVTERPGFESYERVDEWAAPRASPGDGTQGSDGPPDDFPPVGGPHTTFLPVARSSAGAGAEGSEEEEADAAAQFGARRAAGVSPGLPKRRTPTKEEGGKAAAEEEAGRSGGEEEGTAECGVGWAVKDEEEHAASVALATSLHRILAIRASAGERGAPAGLAGAEVERGEADARSAAKTVVHTSGVHGSDDEEEEEEGEEEGGADGGANTAGGRSSSRKSSVRVSGSVEIVGNLTSGSRGSSCSYSTRGSSPTTSPVHGALARPGSGGGESSDGDEAPEGPPRMKRNLTGLPPPPDSEEEEEGEGEGEGGEEEGEEEVEESDPEVSGCGWAWVGRGRCTLLPPRTPHSVSRSRWVSPLASPLSHSHSLPGLPRPSSRTSAPRPLFPPFFTHHFLSSSLLTPPTDGPSRAHARRRGSARDAAPPRGARARTHRLRGEQKLPGPPPFAHRVAVPGTGEGLDRYRILRGGGR